MILPGIKTLKLKRVEDQRGFFCEVFRENAEQLKGLNFVQDNLVLSKQKYTFRGFHGQLGSDGQSKLISVIQGSILDFALDPNPHSDVYGKLFSKQLSDYESEQLLIPSHYLHGYITLEDNTLVSYKVDNYWAQNAEYGANCMDNTIEVDWPCELNEINLSPKDEKLPLLSDIAHYFDAG